MTPIDLTDSLSPEDSTIPLPPEDSSPSNEEEIADTSFPPSIIPAGMSYAGDSDRSIVDEMEKCYLEYAMSVIIMRALPDIRDGLKPVHRRILYAMHDGGLRANSKYRKSARVVGDVLGKYHPHGDTAVYDAMVRMAQDFSMRYTLVDGQGNFGSMDGDSAAAMRYTEVRMSPHAELVLEDIDKDTVDFRPNYDASTEEPVVLPSRLPNLLINGVVGIAVGMATNIPPHNLGEVIRALLFMLSHEEKESITVSDLMQYIHGPDFPTGGIIYNKKDILQAYSTGRGSVVLRGRAIIDEVGSRQAIIITEMPFQVNKETFVEKIANLISEKIIVGVAALRDESNKESVRVVIELKKDAFPKKILNQLYKLTPLQTTFPYNMIALHENGQQPKLFNLKEMLDEFLEHRRIVVERRTAFELRIAQARAHILEGLKIALDHIDEVIKTIRAAESKDQAHDHLMERFSLSDKQAQAILEMQLQRLAGLERKKIEDELAEKLLLIADLTDILAKPERVQTIIADELRAILTKFGDNRKTEVIPGAIGEWNPKDTIPNEPVVISLSKNSYIKRMKSSSFRTQRRGGKGVNVAVKEEDEVFSVLSTQNHNDLLFFTNTGRVFRLPAYEVPETQRTAKGTPIINLLSLLKDEFIASILDMGSISSGNLILISKKGVVKRLETEDITNIRSSGLIVMKPRDGDELGWVRSTTGNDKLVIVSRHGMAIQFGEEDVRVMGRGAAGVRGMNLKENDSIVSAEVVGDNQNYLMTVSENGMGKITEVSEYREQGRGGKGVKVGALTGKTGDIIGMSLLSDEQRLEGEVLLISKSGQTIRIPLKDVRVTSRVTQGVIFAKLKEKGDVFTSATVMLASEEDDQVQSEEDEADDTTL